MGIPVKIFIVDPEAKLIRPMSIVPSLNLVKRLLRTISSNLGHRVLIQDINGEDLLCASKADVDPALPIPEWRIRGGENTSGRGILFGTLDGKREGMWHCPVSLEWLQRNVIWCEPGQDRPADEEPAPKPLLIEQMQR